MRILAPLAVLLVSHASALAETTAADYATLHEAVAANPGRMLHVPPGEYLLEAELRIEHDGGGLYGHGRIIQRNPDGSIVHVVGAKGVRIEGLTLTRADGAMDSTRHGLHVENCDDFEAVGVRVIDNRSQAGTIYLEGCTRSVVRDCLVQNYKRIGIDDRTGSDLYGYAFRVIDGTGILVNSGRNIAIRNNRVIDTNLLPTEEVKAQFQLGQLTEGKQPTKKGRLAPQGDYANNWHQGSAIVITSPESTDHILVTGNHIENAAQGIDIHADHVTCTQNVIDHAFIGIKCMHGSRNVIIAENNVSHSDLWGLVMQSGTASRETTAATDSDPARPANRSAGNIIANNIFSDFGRGHEHFNWKESKSGVISLECGPFPENPVLSDVLIHGNIVYDSSRDDPDGGGPRYEFAVFLSTNPAPSGLRFVGNIFHPGRGGVSNVPLPE